MDNYIFIRKYFNFEILTYIKIKKNYKILDLFINKMNILFVYCQDKENYKRFVEEYSLNGLYISRSEKEESEIELNRRASRHSSNSKIIFESEEVKDDKKLEEGPKMDFFFDYFENGIIETQRNNENEEEETNKKNNSHFTKGSLPDYVKKYKMENEIDEIVSIKKIQQFYFVFYKTIDKKLKFVPLVRGNKDNK